VQPEAGRLFVPIGTGKYLADLPALARLRLKAMGITQVYGNDGSDAWCTVRNPSRFFSHRRDAGPAATALAPPAAWRPASGATLRRAGFVLKSSAAAPQTWCGVYW
jgi:hypothetical protein